MTKTQQRKKLVLFDAHALVHRGYHAIPEMTTSTGEPTGGLFGLTSMLIRALVDHKPDYVAAAYDLPGPTFRHKQFEAYKGTRKKADDELKAQLERSRDAFTALNIPIYDAPGFEADDIIGTIANITKRNYPDVDVLIVTGDADAFQLVDGKRVQVLTLRKGLTDVVLYDEVAVKERFGFGPELLPDYKGLRGDPSDNIPGVEGIGEKTATDLVMKFGDIDNIYKALKRGKLEEEGVKPRVVKLLEAGQDDAEFGRMLATIRIDVPIDFKIPEKTWRESLDLAPALQLFSELEFRQHVVRLKQLFMPVDEVQSAAKQEEEVSREKMRELQVAFWLTEPERGGASLEDIMTATGTSTYADAHKKVTSEIVKRKLDKVWEEIELPLMPILVKMQEKGILLDKKHLAQLSKEYHTQLDRVIKTIYTLAGGEFNISSPKQLGEILFVKLGLATKGIKKTTGGGALSTKESELEKLKDEHPIIQKILEYRELQKVLSTYIDVLPLLTDEKERIHAKFNQDGAVTGRFSSSDPNLQNIPVRDGYGELIRDAFIAPKGKVLMACDYSQIELRILAMFSEDKQLSQIFREGEDIHAAVASRVFKVPLSEVTDNMRRKAKTINFGIIYGMGAKALAGNLGVHLEEAREFHDQYFAAFPTIKEFFDRTLAEATEKGYTTTLFGRRRPFPGLKSKVPFVKAMNERMAMNAPLQGTGADFIKLAMIRVDRAIREAEMENDIAMLLTVHDELIFEVADDEKTLKKAREIITRAMQSVNENTIGKDVPLVVSCAIGKRWGSMMKK